MSPVRPWVFSQHLSLFFSAAPSARIGTLGAHRCSSEAVLDEAHISSLDCKICPEGLGIRFQWQL